MPEAPAPDDRQIELGDLGALVDGAMRCFGHIGEYGTVVCRVDGSLYAFDDHCSHADTPLSGGRLRGFVITCPTHGASFDVRDGSHRGPPASQGIQCHDITVVDGIATLRLGPASQ